MAPEPAYRRLFRLPLGGARRAEQEIDEEIDTHLQLCADALVRQGVPPEEAMQRAIARFGNLAEARQQLRAGAREREAVRRQRDRWGAVLSDIRFAMGQMRRAPGFTALAVLTLALGIGLTTATFTLVNGVLLQPLPLHRPEQLVALLSRDSTGRDIEVVSAGNLDDWRRASPSLSGAALLMSRSMSIAVGPAAIRVPGQLVSGTFFEVLQPALALGRPFTPHEIERQEPVVVVGEGLWRELGADSALARPLMIDGASHTVVGVVRSGGEYPAGTMIWAGVSPPPEVGAMRNNVNWSAVGRLRDGVTLAQARDELQVAAREVRRQIPEALYSYGVGVVPLRDYIVGDADRLLLLLMLAVTAVLLIACANLAAANLSRGAARRREFAVRIAIGAGRGRLIQQVLVEQLCLAVVGGLLGSFIAWVMVRSVVSTWAAEIPRASEVSFDLRVLLFAMVASVVAGLATGLMPALRNSQLSPHGLMSGGNRTASGGRGLPGAPLIAGEIALALVLLTGSGLLLRSFQHLMDRRLGFGVQVVTAEAGLSRAEFPTSQQAALFWGETLRELGSLPGVSAAGVATWVPLGSEGSTFLEISGREPPNQGASYRVVGGDYFTVLEIPLVSGRLLEEGDGAGANRVAIINQRMAEGYWPGESPLGRQVRAVSMEPGSKDAPSPWITVVGVVGNVRHWGMETDPRPEMYVDYRQVPQWSYGMTAVVRGPGLAAPLVRTVQGRWRVVNPNVAVVMGTLKERLDRSLANRRFVMSVLTGFSVVAMTLAAIGLYAVLAYSVARRTRELAVRSALGASRSQLLGLIFAGAGRVVLTGMALGIAGALVLSRSMRALLIEITPFDPPSFLLAIALLLVIAGLAVLAPALRATRSNPLGALQQE